MARNFRYKDIRLPQLRSFCVAATEQNFTKAAQALGLSVPTVWEQVRGLERRLGTALLRRQGRAVELTPAGQLLLDLIHPCVSGLDSLEQVFSTRLADLPLSFTVLSTPYLLAYHLVGMVREFAAKHPSVRLSLRSDVWSFDSLRLVEQGKAEMAIVPYSRDEPRNPLLEYEDLFELELLLLTAADHPLARKRQVTLADVVRFPIVGMSKEGFAQKTLQRLLQRQQLTDQVHLVLESANTDVLCQYVAAGVGVSLIYARGDALPVRDQLHARVFDPELDRLPIALVVRKGAYLSTPARLFEQTVQKHLRKRPSN